MGPSNSSIGDRDASTHKDESTKKTWAQSRAAKAEVKRIKKQSLTATRRKGASYYDTLLWRLRARTVELASPTMLIGITSCARKSGVSTIAANLAIRAADHHLAPVLLVDSHFQFPKQRRNFRLKSEQGLADVLTGRCDIEKAIYRTQTDRLDIMPIGEADQLDRARIEPEKFESLFTFIQENYSTAIFDLPEAEELRHALLIARRLDFTLVVVRHNMLKQKMAETLVENMRADGINIAGAIINRKRTYAPRWLAG